MSPFCQFSKTSCIVGMRLIDWLIKSVFYWRQNKSDVKLLSTVFLWNLSIRKCAVLWTYFILSKRLNCFPSADVKCWSSREKLCSTLINAFRCNKVFPQTQIISGLNFKHNGLMQAELAPDKVTHTHIHIYARTYTHISNPVRCAPLHRKKREDDKGGGNAVHSS